MTAGIYLRQSKDVQDDRLAVTRQRQDCVSICEKRGWTSVEYSDNDTPATRRRGKKLKLRPAFEQLLADMSAGKISAVVVGDADRLVREPAESERFLEIADDRSIPLASANGEYDLATDSGRLYFRIKIAVAKAEMDRKSARQRRANQQLRESGKWNNAGLRPFGYGNGPSLTPEDNKVGIAGQPYEPEASMIKQAAIDVLGGKSLRSIAISWNNLGITTTRGKPWTNLAVRRVLMNPVYAALVTHDRKVVGTGDWTPLLDVDIHHGLVAFLTDPTRKVSVSFERKHLGSGVYTCGVCGNKMYAGYPHGPNRKMTYMCRPTAHVARLGGPVDEYVESVVLAYLTSNRVGAGLRTTETQIDLAALRAKRTGLQARLEELSGAFADGDITIEQLRRGSTKLRTELAGIDAVLAEAAYTSPLAALVGDDADALDDEDVLKTRWSAASADVKGKVIAELMDVVIQRAPRGSRASDPDLIEIHWR